MVEQKSDWREQKKILQSEINRIINLIPLAYWGDNEGFAMSPCDKEWGEAIEAANESLPSPTKAIEILEDKASNSPLDILKAELTVTLIKKWTLEQANMLPQELKEHNEKNEGRGWFIPDFE